MKNKRIPKALLQTGNNLIDNKITKPSSLLMGSGITLTNRGILLKWTTRDATSQVGGFPRPLIKADLVLMI